MTANKLRSDVLKKSEAFIEEMVDVATGKKDNFESKNEWAIRQLWDCLNQIIQKADDPVQIAFKDTEISKKIDDILDQVSKGSITPMDGKKVMALIAMGFEITELPELMAKFDEIG